MTSFNEMHKPKDPSNFVDIISPCYRPPLRYYFVREEMHKRHAEKTYARVEELLRTSLAPFEKASSAFQTSLVAWKGKERPSDLVEGMEELVKVYEEAVTSNVEKPAEPVELTKISTEDLEFVLAMIYDRIIDKVDKLNDYEAWSSETYGETTFEFANEVIGKLNIGEDDVFLDLGSGVGKVVLQAAAMCCCKKAYGIEIVNTRGGFAKGMGKEFRSVMNWMGKKHGDFKLITGDFLDHVNVIRESSIIFCNNFAFEVQLDLKLKNIFADLPEKVKILVSKSLTDEKFRITEKTVSDPSAVLPVRATFNGKMSWTGRDVTFYLHEIDRTMLNRYLEARSDSNKRLQFEEEQRKGRPKYYESSSEPESQNVTTEKSDSEVVDEESDQVPKRVTRSQPPQKTRKRGRPALKDSSNREEGASDSSDDSSTERTRSIPSQVSSNNPRQPVKRRRRGRPPKSFSRSAPSSSNGKHPALDVLFNQTVRNFKDTDRSTQPGCVPEFLSSLDDGLPQAFQEVLEKIKGAMRSYCDVIRRSNYPSQVAEQMKIGQLKVEQLKETQARLEKEVSLLRVQTKKEIDFLFRSKGIAFPRTATELSHMSKEMLQTMNALRERQSSLKDDLNWIESTHQTTAIGVEALRTANMFRTPTHSRPAAHVSCSTQGPNGLSHHDVYGGLHNGFSSLFPPSSGERHSSSQRSASGSHMSSSSHEAKQRKSGTSSSGRPVDLSRPASTIVRSTPLASPQNPRENATPVPRDRIKSTSAQKPEVRQGSASGDPSYMTALGRMIEHSLSSVSKEAQPSPARQEGNLRGPSPRHPSEQPQGRPTFNAQHTSTYPNAQVPANTMQSIQPSSLTAEQMTIAQQYPGAVIHPGAVQVYPGMVPNPYSSHYLNGPYVDASGAQIGFAGPRIMQQDARGTQAYGSSFISRPAIPAGFVSSYPAMAADPAQIAASMAGSLAGSFFAVPGDTRKSVSASQTRPPPPKTFEAISPPPS
ncbi:hypothetical protein RvY_09634 [Ramazzottius varieornatus]|uniref:Histone-lysine N-methyltransferase, H3 lysine-79 specific n=1 Tax=Ramazzottius varieornatus TaxID=947166 RepID=A0A1D1VA21_RAMVA|nr:hypothetical protein RvY_09634 [Ramazzottius varieornatus]